MAADQEIIPVLGLPNDFQKVLAAIAAATFVSACAGRDPMRSQRSSRKTQLRLCDDPGEISANNTKATELANEQGMKVAQNVGAGVVGLVIWPVWFGMDFKGAASKDAAALQARLEYLTQLAVQRCNPPAPPPPRAKKR